MNIIFASGGNDSVALFQFAVSARLKNIHVAYSDTGWANEEWPERIEKFKAYVESCGAVFHTIQSEGMINLIKRKKAWPANGMAFCSYELKIKPAMS